MRTYPVEWCLEGRSVVVVGGGRVAARKVVGLLEAGARVTAISPHFCDELQALEVRRLEQPYEAAVLAGASAVFACTDDAAVNAQVAADARAAGVPCCIADDPAGSDFLVPAVMRRGRLTVAVGTGGACPGLAVRVRDQIASRYGMIYATLVDELAAARTQILAATDDDHRRRGVLDKLCTECSVKLLERGGVQAWRDWVRRLLRRGTADPQADPRSTAGGDEV